MIYEVITASLVVTEQAMQAMIIQAPMPGILRLPRPLVQSKVRCCRPQPPPDSCVDPVDILSMIRLDFPSITVRYVHKLNREIFWPFGHFSRPKGQKKAHSIKKNFFLSDESELSNSERNLNKNILAFKAGWLIGQPFFGL